MELEERKQALLDGKYLMLPQLQYADYYYMVDGEIRDISQQKLNDEELLYELLEEECTECRVTNMLTFPQDSKDAFEEYHYDDGMDFEEFSMPLSSEFDSRNISREAKAEILNECNFDKHRLSPTTLMNLIGSSLKKKNKIEHIAEFYEISEKTIRNIKLVIDKESTC